jgi:hypothetical protein
MNMKHLCNFALKENAEVIGELCLQMIWNNIFNYLIQREIVTFQNTKIFTQSKQQFSVRVIRTYLDYSNALSPVSATATYLTVLVLDYTKFHFQRKTHNVIRLFKSLRHIKPRTGFHHIQISYASTSKTRYNIRDHKWYVNCDNYS